MSRDSTLRLHTSEGSDESSFSLLTIPWNAGEQQSAIFAVTRCNIERISKHAHIGCLLKMVWQHLRQKKGQFAFFPDLSRHSRREVFKMCVHLCVARIGTSSRAKLETHKKNILSRIFHRYRNCEKGGSTSEVSRLCNIRAPILKCSQGIRARDCFFRGGVILPRSYLSALCPPDMSPQAYQEGSYRLNLLDLSEEPTVCDFLCSTMDCQRRFREILSLASSISFGSEVGSAGRSLPAGTCPHALQVGNDASADIGGSSGHSHSPSPPCEANDDDDSGLLHKLCRTAVHARWPFEAGF